MKINIYECLICPDCQSKLELHEHLICRSCGRIFLSREGVLNLLPRNLSQYDLAEEQFWSTDSKESLEAHPLLSLMVKSNVILYFWEQILPKLKLQGKVLEIGSGLGWLSSLVKLKFPETYVIATDVATAALLKSVQVSRFLDLEIDCFITSKVEQLPFENGFFDYVIGSAILHHTSPYKALRQIFRVLKENGTYIGIGELSIPRVLGFLWGSGFLMGSGHREKELGVKEGNYSFDQWRRFFEEAGFKDVRFSLERNPRYKQYSWFVNSYYQVVSRLPESLVERYLACSMGITAKKS